MGSWQWPASRPHRCPPSLSCISAKPFHPKRSEMAFLCFPLMVGRMRITIFHFLLSCTLVFSLMWGYLIVTVISSAFKEDEGKYKVVPAAERNVNALDFFK